MKRLVVAILFLVFLLPVSDGGAQELTIVSEDNPRREVTGYLREPRGHGAAPSGGVQGRWIRWVDLDVVDTHIGVVLQFRPSGAAVDGFVDAKHVGGYVDDI